MFKNFSNSRGLLGLYGVWHCYDEAVTLLSVGLDIFCELHSEASTELHSTMQNSHFTTLLKWTNGTQPFELMA
jgi:hypothetical protein